MSFYIGKDNIGSSVMHISKNAASVDDLKAGERSDTVFHSDMKFLTYEEIPCTFSSKSVILDRNVASVLGGSNAYIMIIINGKVFDGGFFQDRETYWSSSGTGIDGVSYAYSSGMWYDGGGGAAGWYYGNRPTYTYNAFQGRDTIYSAKVLKLNIVNNAYIPLPRPAIDILIGSGTIKVKGFDLLNLKYLSKTGVNATDYKFTGVGGAQFQLVDSSTGSSVGISTENSKVEIRSGNKVVVSSSLSVRQFVSGIGSLDIDEIKLYSTGWSPREKTTTQKLYFSSFSGETPTWDDTFILNYPYATLFGRSDLKTSGAKCLLSGRNTSVKVIDEKDVGVQGGYTIYSSNSTIYWFNFDVTATLQSDGILLTFHRTWNSNMSVWLSTSTMRVFTIR